MIAADLHDELGAILSSITFKLGEVEACSERGRQLLDESRDHIGNWLLRAFSIFGLVTVVSGFALFFISSKWGRKRVAKSVKTG